MNAYYADIGDGRRVTATCSDSVSKQVQWVLELLVRLGRERDLLKDGARIRVGWVILTLRGQGADLAILAPAFDRDPFHDLTEDLTVFLSVQAKQNDLLRLLGLDGEEVSFQDKVVTAKGALIASHVYLERTSDRARGDSGWYVGPSDDSAKPATLEGHLVYELVSLRPALLPILALPSGYLVVVAGEEIQAVLNEKNVDVWAAAVAAS
jgi:hypothetical protein